jgi:phage-related protein (TIGR01555 family)
MRATKKATRAKKGLSVSAFKAAQLGSERPLLGLHGGPKPDQWAIPEPPPGVLPNKALQQAHAKDQKVQLAMDEDLQISDAAVVGISNWAGNSFWNEGLGFLGYSYLAQLSQRAEYRRPVEILAKNMTQKWIKLHSTSRDDKKTDKLERLSQLMEDFDIRKLFRSALQAEGFFGRAQIYVDVGNNAKPEELSKPLSTDKVKIRKGSLQGFRLIEPTWSYPGPYNASNPLQAHFYDPQTWYVMGKTVHTSRLLHFVSRPLPDLLKPVYSFGGLALTQMAKPYVDNWLTTRQSVNDLIQAFSTMVLSTDMSAILAGGEVGGLVARAQMFNNGRNNRGLMLLDKDMEDLKNIAVPLGTLDHLQAQAQEHMAAVVGIPLVVLLGITPSGLNASSDGEIRTYYGWIKSQQEDVLTPPLLKVLRVLQLHEWGEIDHEIGFSWQPLFELDEKTRADMRKTQADTDAVYIEAGVIDADEARERLASEDESPYAGLEGPAPGPQEDELEGEPGGFPFGGGAPQEPGDGEEDAPLPPGHARQLDREAA